MSAATMNEMDRLRQERDALAEKLAVATKRLEDRHMAPPGWISGDRYEAVSREKMDYRRRWKEACEERDALAGRVTDIEEYNVGLANEAHELRQQRDALAVNVAQLMGAMELARDRIVLLAEVATDRGAKVYAALDKWPEEMAEILAESPTTSLARLKARWQAEALEEALEAVVIELGPLSGYRSASIMASKAAELRRRAEERTNGNH